MANNVVIDGFTLYIGTDIPAENTRFSIFGECAGAKTTLPFPYVTPKTLTISDIKTENGAECVVTYAPENYKDLVIKSN